MNNTALKLSSQEVVNEFKEAHGSLDLLKVYLITGSADIGRSSELITKWAKNAMNDVDRANFKNALEMLQAIELKRIALTAAVYGVAIPTTSEETNAKVETITEATKAEEEVKTIVMIPTLKDVQERVQNILKIEDKEFSDTERKATAFKILKESVGQGLVLGKETWTDEQITAYIDTSISINVPTSEETQVEEKKQETEQFGFETIYNYIQDMIKASKEEPEIKELLKPMLIGKIITSKKDDYLIKDDAVFEDYYNRILKNIITVNITAFVNTNKTVTEENEKTVVDKKVEEQITPLLQNLDKDEKETSIAPAVKEARTIYESSGIKTSLKEAMTKVKKIASSIAPNLMKRHEGATKSNIPTVEKTEVGAVEIYDDSHNIEESNKPLWAEAKNYKYLGQIFNKGVELSKAGNWRDALSMCIILLSSGNIKEGKKSEETIKWDAEQVKLWYYSTIEKTVVDKKVEEQITPLLQNLDKDEKETSIAPAVKEARTIYENSGIKTSLKDAMTKVKKIASAIAPNLMKRHEGATKSNIPTVEKTEVGAIEIYDDSHNIEESNKPLWAEVKNYRYLGQIFNKGVELSKAGNWRDALSMCIRLLSSGNIKEGKKSEETIKWDAEQIKLWYYSTVEKTVNAKKEETVDAVATEVKEETKTENKPTESKEQGPVPQAGTIDSKEPITRLLKDNSAWKDTYSFKSFELSTDHYHHGKMFLEIVDATPEQESALLITEANLTKFFDEQKDKLVTNANAIPEVKKTLNESLAPFYELTASEIKHIVNQIAKDASVIRKVNKIASKAATALAENTEEDKLPFTKKKTETKSTETIPTPEPTKPEVKEEPVNSPPENTPVEEKPKEEKVENEEKPSDTTPTQDTAGEKPSNSNNKEMYEGFKDIIKAKQAGEMHKAIYSKVMEYPTQEEGINAVFKVIDAARKDKFFKHYFVRNYKGSDKEAILAKIHKVVETGISLSKSKDN